MQLNGVRYFVTLSQTLNFTKAAELCNVSQPAFTRAIQSLEEELGGLLISRERDNTHLTALGRLILPHLQGAVSGAETATTLATRFIKLERAELTVGVMCTIGPMHFVSFLGDFRTRNPGIALTLIEAQPDQLSAMLLNGTLDVAIMARSDGYHQDLHTSQLYCERFVIACSVGHRFAGLEKVPIGLLDGEAYFLRINCEFRDVLRDLCMQNDVHVVYSYRSEREDWILTMVAAGLGMTFLPEFSTAFPGVIGRPLAQDGVNRRLCLVTVAGRRHSAPLAVFVDAIQSYGWPDTIRE